MATERQPLKPHLIVPKAALLKHSLPSDYVQFLRERDGGEGFVGTNNYLILWKAEELSDFNREYEVRYAHQVFSSFGSNGGGEGYGSGHAQC